MARVLVLFAVGAILFACAPKPEPRAPKGTPLDVTALAEIPDLVVTDESDWPVDLGLERVRLDSPTALLDWHLRRALDEATTEDNIGWSPAPPPEEYHEPEPLPVDRRREEAELRLRRYHENGGNPESQRALAMGLAWLARRQQRDGAWEFDGPDKDDRVGATALALLAYLRAGCTHKPLPNRDENKYRKTVAAGFIFLISKRVNGGADSGRMSTNVTAHALATLALCEAYGRTSDPVVRSYAQAGLKWLQYAQAADGGWGEPHGETGDLATTAWAIEALHAGRAAGLAVEPRAVTRAIKFLDALAGNARKSTYGTFDRKDAAPGTTATATGLLCRHMIDGWTATHPGMIDGTAGLEKNPPAKTRDPVYLYYTLRVFAVHEGEAWQNWNEGPKGADGVRKNGVRDLLVAAQTKNSNDEPTFGSWPGTDGRHRATCLALITLETYCRYPASNGGK